MGPLSPGSLRFAREAADALRRAVREAGGVEVFAIGDVEGPDVVEVTVTCRGREHEVNALLDRPRAGQVVVHNHPSGDLRPSDADMALAGRYGEEGVGFVIVDSDVTRSHWVVEPHRPRRAAVDPADVEAFFREALPAAMPDWEGREGQVGMALAVARALSDERPLVCEAGTGTGKSLAYLAPAALWTLANDGKVVVSTYTRALQAQLFGSDLPMLRRGGLQLRAALLQGRNNYLCKRRLEIALDDEDLAQDDAAALRALAGWEATSESGARRDLPVDLDPELWERVQSDADLTLRQRCPHFAICHYYRARREAAAAHVVVVNHALLLSDLAIRDAGGDGILPKYARVILDEAHHLEDAATSVVARDLSARGVRRAALPLLPRRRRKGALERLAEVLTGPRSPVEPGELPSIERKLEAAREAASTLADTVGLLAVQLGDAALEGQDRAPRRVTRELQATAAWQDEIRPTSERIAEGLEAAGGALQAMLGALDGLRLDARQSQPLLDVQRAARRLAAQAATARDFLRDQEGVCRWVEPARGAGESGRAALALAPVEVGPTLKRILWDRLPGAACTSATMTVGGSFEFWQRRVGLAEADTGVFPSPFDHAAQALLGLPRDLPSPEDPSFLEGSTPAVVEAVTASQGGAFVLCTSYAAVRHYARALEAALPPGWPVLAQRESGREALLARFRESRNAVLVGTDSFWEGVSVKGEGLRLVVVPRLPFRVPTEPLLVARQEALERRGLDAFRSYSLPQATLRLKQGYGRLIRARTDRGVVLFLDRRLHDRAYGALMLRSMPPARRVTGPWRRVREEIELFFAGMLG